MKISTKGRYGLRILVDLATHDAEKPRLIRDIAESQGISEKYISRLVIDLRKAKMIRSIRGVNGGFHHSAIHNMGPICSRFVKAATSMPA